LAGAQAKSRLTGYGMGDAYRSVWDCLVETTRLRLGVLRALAQPGLMAEARSSLEKRGLRKEITSLLLDILPYERPRQIKSDGAHTAFVKPDLSGLTDEELDAIERIALKLGPPPPLELLGQHLPLWFHEERARRRELRQTAIEMRDYEKLRREQAKRGGLLHHDLDRSARIIALRERNRAYGAEKGCDTD
jgi:hypothetical protein